MPFNLEDYEPVAARLARWLEWCAARNLQPRVVTHLVHYSDQRCVFRAELYLLDPETRHEILVATGWEEETRGDGMVNKTSHLANCETGSLGRALANAGLSGSDPHKRASREEMAKVVRMGGTPAASSSDGDGTRLATEKQRGYLRKLAHDRGLTTQQAQEEAIEQLLGKLVPISLLSPAQASAIIEAWKGEA